MKIIMNFGDFLESEGNSGLVKVFVADSKCERYVKLNTKEIVDFRFHIISPSDDVTALREMS